MVIPITDAIFAMPCSRSEALLTPAPIAAVSPPIATPVAVANPATVAVAAPPNLPRLFPMPSITPEALSSALITIFIVSWAIYRLFILSMLALRRSTAASTLMTVVISCSCFHGISSNSAGVHPNFSMSLYRSNGMGVPVFVHIAAVRLNFSLGQYHLAAS